MVLDNAVQSCGNAKCSGLVPANVHVVVMVVVVADTILVRTPRHVMIIYSVLIMLLIIMTTLNCPRLSAATMLGSGSLAIDFQAVQEVRAFEVPPPMAAHGLGDTEPWPPKDG